MTAYRSNTRRKESLRRGDLLTDRSAPELNQSNDGPGWGSVALRTTAVVAGIATVAAIVRAGQRRTGNGQAHANGVNGANAMNGEPEVERSITIACSADELYQKWRDPQTLSRIMDGFASTQASGDGRMHWQLDAPLGRRYEWDSETVDDRPGESVGWRSIDGGDIRNEGSLRFRPAPADRGTVATLRFRFQPPGGALGEAAVRHLARMPLNLAADGVLRRFKSLVETGEIPTTERQPAARADTR